jgi:hypothetical protein
MADPYCTACRNALLVTEREKTEALCSACRNKVQAPDLRADPRPRIPCRGCGHHQLVRTILVDETESSFETAGVAVTEPRVSHGAWSGEVRSIRPGFARRAPLIVYVCRGCGLTELYTDGFADIPVGPQYGAELIDVGPPTGGPFR